MKRRFLNSRGHVLHLRENQRVLHSSRMVFRIRTVVTAVVAVSPWCCTCRNVATVRRNLGVWQTRGPISTLNSWPAIRNTGASHTGATNSLWLDGWRKHFDDVQRTSPTKPSTPTMLIQVPNQANPSPSLPIVAPDFQLPYRPTKPSMYNGPVFHYCRVAVGGNHF
jgi:hypothetical protein